MTLELLYLRGCPNHGRTVHLLRSVLHEGGVNAAVQEILVNNYEEARDFRFRGSPTVRVNGEDIESGQGHRVDVGFACRMYFDEGKLLGVPPRSWVERAVRAARRLEDYR
jgi:hypothetical protein